MKKGLYEQCLRGVGKIGMGTRERTRERKRERKRETDIDTVSERERQAKRDKERERKRKREREVTSDGAKNSMNLPGTLLARIFSILIAKQHFFLS